MAGRDLSSELFGPEGDKSKGRDLSADLFGKKPTGPAGFSLGDLGASFGIGALGSTKALTDVAGAENIASSKLSQGIQGLQTGMTPERQAEMQRQAERMKAAEQSGSFLQEVKAAGQNVLEAPLQTAAQAIGSFVPYLPAMFAAPVAAAMRLGPGAVRAIAAVAEKAPASIATAQGLGAVKGSIYDGVYQAEVDAGTSPDIAKQKADSAQNYFGTNFEQIALGGALGRLAGTSGVEKFLTPAGRAGAAPGLARRVGETVVKESIPEGVQGGQERLAQNIALQRGGFDVDTFSGVAGAATGEALAGALGAAPIAALSGRPTPPPVVTPPAAQAPVAPEPAPVAPVAPAEPLAIGMSEPFTPRILPDGSVANTQEELDAYDKKKFEDQYAPQPVEKEAVSPISEMKPAEVGYERSLLGAPVDPLAAIVEKNRLDAEKAKLKQYNTQIKDLEQRVDANTNPVILEARARIVKEKADLEETIAILEQGFMKIYEQEVKPEEDAIAAAKLETQTEEDITPPITPAILEEAPPFVEATPIVGEPAPQLEEITDLQKDLDRAEKSRRRFTQGKDKGLSLWTALRGKLTPEEVEDIGPGLMFKSLQKKGGVGGTDMSSLVSDSKLDDFLPPRMRPMSEFYDEQESVEYIKEKVRRQNYYTFDTTMAIQNLDNTVDELEKAIREFLTLKEVNLEIQKATDEQAEIDRATEEAPAESETRVTPEREGKDATPAEGLTSPTPQDIIDKQEAAAKAEKQRKDEEKAKEDKAKADAAKADFTLTGSDREADEAAARGQKDIFTTSAKVKPPELDTTGIKPSKGRNLQVQAAGKKFQEGTMSREEFTKYVDYYTPIKDVDIQKLQPPASNEQMEAALRGGGRGVLNAPIKEGTRVGLRMDLPAREAGANVVSIHEGKANNNPKTGEAYSSAGSLISYASVARIKDVFFAPRDQEKGLNMGINPVKERLQTAEGTWVPITPEQAFAEVKRLGNDPAWTQVNVNPAQRGYFYDRVTGEPVVKASELIQVGNFILAKDVEYAPKEDFLYSAEGSTLGFNNTKENLEIAKQIKGKTLVEVSKWAIDNAPNAVAKYFAQKVYARIKQMEAKGVRFGFDVLTGDTRPNTPALPMRNARGVASFIWGDKSKGEDTTIRIVLNGPTVFKNQDGYPPGVEYRTILHELLHVATRGQLHFLQASDPMVKEIRLLFNQVIAHYQKDFKNGTLSGIAKDYYDRKNNAFRNDDELVSWGITDERMQKYMSGIKVGEGTVFSKLIELIRKILGVAPPYESALDRLVRTTDELLSVDIEEISEGIERQGYSFGPGKKKATTGVQQSLFSKKVQELFANQEGTPSKDADSIMAQLGRKVKPPEPSYRAKVRQSWDNVKDNPKLTAEEAGKSVTTFLDKVQTMAFSSDAALNNRIRRAIYDSTMAAKDKIGTLLNTSISQTVHADALASLFITLGNLKYNRELHKWEAFNDDANFIQLSKDIDVIAEKYGKTKAEAEVIAHTAFEAKRLKSMVEFNNQIDREVAAMKAEAASIRSSKPVASSALSEKASNRLKEKKFIHKINGESDLSVEDQIAAGMSLFAVMPELNAAVKTWNSIRANTSRILVDSGLWTEEEAEFLLDNADYVPFFREEQLEEGKGPKEYIRGLMVQAKEKKLKGSDKPVNDIFDNMIRWTQYSVNRAVRNKSAVALADAAEEVGAAIKIKDVKNKENLGITGVDANKQPIVGKISSGAKPFDSLKQAGIANKELDGFEVVDFEDEDGNTKYLLTPKVERVNVAKVWKNGKQVEYSMEDPMYMEAFNGLEAIVIPSWKWMSELSNWLRQTVVLYPLFSVSQLPQDSFAAMFTSGLKPRYALTIPARAAKEFLTTLFKQSQTHENLKKYGVVGVRDFTAEMVRLDAEVYAGFKAKPGVLGRTKDLLSHIAMASDNAVRQAVYTASIDQGLSEAEALEKAFEIWNVRRKGSSKTLALAGQVIPFFNAYLAAQNVAYKTITGVGSSPTERENAFKTLIATTGSVMTLSLLYVMLNGDDEDYENKPAVVRDRLLMIPGTGGLSIPLRADLFTLPKIITEHTYLLLTDQGYEDGRKFRDSIKAALGSALLSPTVVPQAIKPLVEVGINYNFFSGRPLIGEFEKKKETAQQFSDTTSEIAKLLGATGLVSPIAVDHLIRGMFGSAGGLVIYMTNPVLHSDPNVDRPSLSLRDAMATLPGTSGFISREYESGLKNDFYVLRDEVAKVAATVSDLKTTSPEKIEEYLSSEEKMARYGLAKGVNKITDQLGKVRKAITYITNRPSSEMSSAEKQEAIKELRETEREILKTINVKELRKMAQV
jgi:hypothetical protein